MSLQHAQQLIAELYDYAATNWSTPDSAFARNYLEHRTEGKKMKDHRTVSPARRRQLADRVDRELAR